MTKLAVTLVVFGLMLVACGGDSSPETFTVSGTITVQPGSAMLAASSRSGDRQAQPATASHPGPGAALEPRVYAGDVAATEVGAATGPQADAVEHYELHLDRGQHIVLEFPESAGADLHLYLLDPLGIALDASVDAVEGPTAGWRSLSLVAPEEGRYIVRVAADRGNAAYVLSLYPGLSPAHEMRRGPRASDDFVVHEVLVRGRPGALASLSSRAERLGFREAGGGSGGERLWKVHALQARPVMDELRGWRSRREDVFRWATPKLQERYETLLIARGLRTQPDVATVSPNFILKPQAVPNDPRYSEQWFHWNIDLPQAWEISTGLADDGEVVVAVIDTGVFRGHEDLQGKLLQGYDFVLDEPGGDDPGPGIWHGTHVAGIIGAATDNGIGIAGVSWGAQILPVRVLTEASGADGEGEGRLSDVLDGIRYAAGLPFGDEPSADPRAEVINLSLGGEIPCDDWSTDFFREIRDLGIFLVAASGNSPDGSGAITFPASCDSVFAVGASDRENRRAPYSHYGDELDFVAPGGLIRSQQSPDGILSTIANGSGEDLGSDYAFYQGTSMAAAVASGVVALARSVDPALTPVRFAEMLECGLLTDDIAAAGWDTETGWGQINALKTLQLIGARRDGMVHVTSDSVGPIHVRLLNAAREIVAESAVDPDNCRYPYRFEDVPKGDYWIVAGTDSADDDWLECGIGEFCGAYPALADPQPVRVDRDREALDFELVSEQ
ncbi:S8 family serine peptidase [Thioalkalivibrio sp.]|uniref:S8 family serine peptidase n=1 Tax=Thioalkalivibrio sp. TaxID=2093813 RepID=UPI0035696015